MADGDGSKCDVCWVDDVPLKEYKGEYRCQQCQDNYEIAQKENQLQLLTEKLIELEIEKIDQDLWKE